MTAPDPLDTAAEAFLDEVLATSAMAEDVLRALTWAALRNAGLSQAEAARRLDVSTKHLCQMLTGRAVLTLAWSEALLGLCGQRLTLDTAPIHQHKEAS